MQERIYDEFVPRFAERVARIQVGYGLDPGVTLGPMVNERSVVKVSGQGQGQWSRSAVNVSGQGQWSRSVVKVSSQGQ